MIRLLLAEDQDIVREGMRVLLELKSDFQVVGEASNGQEAIDRVEQLQLQNQLPDVILMDIRMPIVDGVAATQQICQKFPSIKILVFTTFDDTKYVTEALRVGAKGYLLKDTPSEELAEVIRSVHRGYTQFSPGILEKVIAATAQPQPAQALPPGFKELSPREREILCLLAKGASNKEIARMLVLTEGTIRNHVSNILTRLNLRDRIQAAVVATPFISWLEQAS